MGSSNLFQKISTQKSSTRVAVNTVIIYVQRLSAAVLSLITTPIVLNALGVEDYGIYVLTVGLVGTVGFINWSLSSATQRYIAFSIGAGDLEKLKKVFASSLLLHGAYALVLLLLIWFFGGFFVDRFLTIPESRISIAKIILKFVSVITFINIVTVPFTGLFRAHENFLYIGIIGITESVLKLGIALSLLFIGTDKLIAYSGLLLVVSLLIFSLNVIFSKKFHQEVNLNIKNFDKGLISEMLGFISWSILGAASVMSRNQGVSVLLNIFFGVVVNAAYGIAMQVNSAIGILSQGITGSISPQMVKSAGAGETEKMLYLMRTMSKFAVISVSFVAIPLIIETPLILKIWLKNVPEGAVLFSRLTIAFGLIMVLSAGIHNVFDAIGKVKLYNIWISLILILNLPLAYIFFKLGQPSYTIILTGMFLETVSLFVRLYLLKKYVNFSVPGFLSDVIFKIIIPMVILICLVILIRQFDLSKYLQLFTTLFLSVSLYPLIVYYFSLDRKQKAFAIEILSKGADLFIKLKNRV